MLGRTLAMSCLCAGAALAAEPVPLKGTTIKNMIGAGATIELDTPLGTKVPIRFSPDGQIQGEAGAVAAYLGAAKDTGRWWVSGDKLCQQWARWLEGQKQCLSLQQNGRQILWQSDEGKSGTATVTIRHQQVAATETPPAPYGLGVPPAATGATPAPRVAPQAGEVAAFVMTAPKMQPQARPQPASAASASRIAPSAAKPASEKVAAATASPARTAAVAPSQPSPAAPRREPAPAYVSASAAPVVPPPADPTFMVVGVRASDVLNVRAGPSSEHPQVGAIPPESRGVRVTGRCAGGWCPVEHAGRAGWVNSLYLAEEMGGGRY